MEIAVWDTYVTNKDGQIMHFDVIVPDGTSQERVLEFAKRYLNSINQAGQKCGAEECKFFHIKQARPRIEQSIRDSGYYLLEMERRR